PICPTPPACSINFWKISTGSVSTSIKKKRMNSYSDHSRGCPPVSAYRTAKVSAALHSGATTSSSLMTSATSLDTSPVMQTANRKSSSRSIKTVNQSKYSISMHLYMNASQKKTAPVSQNS